MRKLSIGLIGHKFMGRAHTHAYTDIPIFFPDGTEIVKHTLCSPEESVLQIAKVWGFEKGSLRWQDVVDDPEVDIIEIAAPSEMHAEVAIAAASAGKHVFCEKPLALTLEDAEAMVEAVNKAKVVNGIGFNYRRVPALAYARNLIQSGQLGEIFHFRGIYQQDWLVDPTYPLVWRLQKKAAGYGTHGDMGAHVIDLAHYLVGEITEICGLQETFVRERPIPTVADGLRAIAGTETGIVDVDDASLNLVRFSGKKTLGYIEATRYGTGHKNQNRIEVSGSKGGIIFDMEQMNDLLYYNVDDQEGMQGFRRIQIGETIHPYMSAWWPAGHIIGYGDTFVNQAHDFISCIVNNSQFNPDFEDGLKCQRVLQAAYLSAQQHRWINL